MCKENFVFSRFQVIDLLTEMKISIILWKWQTKARNFKMITGILSLFHLSHLGFNESRSIVMLKENPNFF